MLMALAYGNNDQIVAAAPACDPTAHGPNYWLECHPAKIDEANIFETAYVSIEQADLVERLLMLGVDQSVNSAILTQEVESYSTASPMRQNKAA
ncbi:MAG: hypothetical protein AB8B55_06070 [Mariniblastus sp.]